MEWRAMVCSCRSLVIEHSYRLTAASKTMSDDDLVQVRSRQPQLLKAKPLPFSFSGLLEGREGPELAQRQRALSRGIRLRVRGSCYSRVAEAAYEHRSALVVNPCLGLAAAFCVEGTLPQRREVSQIKESAGMSTGCPPLGWHRAALT